MKKFLLGILLCSFGITVNAQTYVNANATGANNGTSWADAYTDLHSATYNTTSGEIWVAQGTYVPTRSSSGNISGDARENTFNIRFNVQVYGGFDGTETALSQRDWRNNPTILSGYVTPSYKAYHVVRFIGNNNTTVLDGFTIENGNAVGGSTPMRGGAIYMISNSAPIIRNCNFINNTANEFGGAISANDGSPQIENCKFKSNNTNQYDGAAIYLLATTNVNIVNCLFDDNASFRHGGAILVIGSTNVKIYNNTFVNNTSGSGGSGNAIQISYSSPATSATVQNCIFFNNTPNVYDVSYNGAVTLSILNCLGSTFLGTSVANNIAGAPQFIDFNNGDYNLQCESPAVNSGDASGLTLPSTDLNGNPRNVYTLDMGAFENQNTTISVSANKTVICPGDYVTLKGTCDPTGYSWDNGVVDGVAFYPTTTQTYTCTGIGSASTEQITIIVTNITDENITGPTSVCLNSSATVNLANSANGVEYFLRDDATGYIIDGPITGTGSTIDFTTNNIATSTTYNVIGSVNPEISATYNTALDFDGSNDRVITQFVVPTTNTLTIEALIYPRATIYNRIISNYTGATIGNYIVDTYNSSFNNGRGLRFVVYSPSLAQFSVENVLTLNEWNHIAITFNNGLVKLYVNGIEVGSSTFPFSSIPTNTSSNFMCFGEDYGVGTAEYFNGKMDEVRVWNVARTSTEIIENQDNCFTGNESGLIAYFDFENSTTTNFNDLVSGNNASMLNMDAATDWVTSGSTCGNSILDLSTPVGTALDFDGSNDIVSTTLILPTTSTLSIESWVYPRSTNYDRLISNYVTTVSGSIILDTYNATNNGRGIRFNVYGAGNTLYSVGAANTLTLNAWNHVAATFDNGVMTVYVNGFEVANGTAPFASIPQTTSSFVFGEDNVIGTAEHFNGKMDEVRFWNKSLSQSEIMADMNNCLTGSETNLVAYYNFEDAAGILVSDITANQYHGVMQNMDANTDWVDGQFGCTVTCEQEMTQTITIAPVNVDNTTTLNANQISSNQTGANYRWLDCNNSYVVISGETAQTFAPTANGSYAVEISLNGCTDTSACVNITSVGINNINTTNMSISPNPVKDYLFINGNEQVIKATIYTINGCLVQTLNTLDNKINVSNLSQGMYILMVQTDKGITQNKFIKE